MQSEVDDRIPEHRLLAAVVASAVRDCCLPPIGKRNVRLHPNAATAFDFIFTDSSDPFLELVDINAGNFKLRLQEAMNDTSNTDQPFKAIARRAFRINHKLWKSEYARLGGRVAGNISDDDDDSFVDFEE
jgi:hypothetical protein